MFGTAGSFEIGRLVTSREQRSGGADEAEQSRAPER
jgi:hypothetical protein